MGINYVVEASRINAKYKKYQKDIEEIFNFSESVSKDLTKYVLKVLSEDNNPEIGRLIVEAAFNKHASMLTVLKSIVKILYVVQHITKYKHTTYFSLKGHIDAALDKLCSTKAEIAKKKYELLLARVNAENGGKELNLPEQTSKSRPKIIDEIRDNINKKYIRFV